MRQKPRRIELEVRRGKVVRGNAALSDFLGVPVRTRDDYIACIHPDDLAYIQRKLRRVLDTRERYTAVVRLRSASGTYCVCKFVGAVTVVECCPDRIVGILYIVCEGEEDRPLKLPWNTTRAKE
jgi:PAS domain-containing protein